MCLTNLAPANINVTTTTTTIATNNDDKITSTTTSTTTTTTTTTTTSTIKRIVITLAARARMHTPDGGAKRAKALGGRQYAGRLQTAPPP